MANLVDLTLVEARDGLIGKQFSARELTTAYLDRMAEKRHLNAYITETSEFALATADVADQRLRRGEARQLEGVPLAVKDLYCTKGVRTTAASHMLENFVPPYESEVTRRLWDSGAVLLGKTNMDEFAMGSATTTSYFGSTINPCKRQGDDTDLVAGGSSGGSAAAVAAHTAVASLGSDTGGSIRQPASFCGAVGMKPTYGRCSRWGMIAYASSLDQAGPIARTMRDVAALLGVISGHDAKDSTSANVPVPDFESFLGQSVRGMRIGVPREYRLPGLRPDVAALWERAAKLLEEGGAQVEDVSLPMSRFALPCYYIIATAEASSNLARYDGIRYGLRVDGDSLTEMYKNTRSEGFGAEVRRRIMLGTFTLSSGYYDAYYNKAQRVRALIARDFAKAFQSFDALLFPTSPIPAFPVGALSADPLEMYLIDVYTVTVNLAGLPAVSVPLGLSTEGLPLGMQLVSRPFDEASLFRAGSYLEQFCERPPTG